MKTTKEKLEIAEQVLQDLQNRMTQENWDTLELYKDGGTEALSDPKWVEASHNKELWDIAAKAFKEMDEN